MRSCSWQLFMHSLKSCILFSTVTALGCGRLIIPIFLSEKQVLSRPMFYLPSYLEQISSGRCQFPLIVGFAP